MSRPPRPKVKTEKPRALTELTGHGGQRPHQTRPGGVGVSWEVQRHPPCGWLGPSARGTGPREAAGLAAMHSLCVLKEAQGRAGGSQAPTPGQSAALREGRPQQEGVEARGGAGQEAPQTPHLDSPQH